MSQYKKPEYTPYSTFPSPQKANYENDYYLTKDELIKRLEDLSIFLDEQISLRRDSLVNKTIVNSGNDKDFNKQLHIFLLTF